MLKKASRTSPRDANPAETQRKQQLKANALFMMQFVPSAEKKLKFLSNLPRTDPFTAASVTQSLKSRLNICILNPFGFIQRGFLFGFIILLLIACTVAHSVIIKYDVV